MLRWFAVSRPSPQVRNKLATSPYAEKLRGNVPNGFWAYCSGVTFRHPLYDVEEGKVD